MDPKRRLEIVPSRIATQIGVLPAPVLEMARLCDGTRTLEAISAATRLPAEQLGSIVQRLVALGVVRESSARKQRQLSEKALAWAHGRAPTAFSDDEEKFFASPIDHLVEE